MGYFTLIIIVLVICGSCLLAQYMYLCSVNEVRMFEDPRYYERISALEKRVDALEARE